MGPQSSQHRDFVSRQATAFVASGQPERKSETFAGILHRARLLDVLGRACPDRPAAETSIAIKVDLGASDAPAAGEVTATDPALVELLVDHLHDAGYQDVLVVAGGDDALGRADALGYQFCTPGGREYDIVQADEEPGRDGFGPHSVLRGVAVTQFWTDAHIRLVFAKNTTDGTDYHKLCLASLLDLVDGSALDAVDIPTELLRALPVHFALIDAWDSSHGRDGLTVPLPVGTHTFVACVDPILADWVGAFKMGLDPHASQVVDRALETIGLPGDHDIVGDLTPYPGFRVPDPLYVEARRAGGREFRHGRPHATVNESRPAEGALQDMVGYWSCVSTGFGRKMFERTRDAYRTLYAKDRLRQQSCGLGFDPADFDLDDYRQTVPYLEQLERIVGEVPSDSAGLRWCYLDQSVVFQYARILPIPFADFTAAVDVSQSVQMMNDYLGGASIVIRHDDAGRPTHQATRTLYLPQPNFQVAFGGKPIDVSKIEYVDYQAEQQKVYWRTVKSLNGSAAYDDGSVAFRDMGTGKTRISIVARQEFDLPWFWKAIQIDLHDRFKRSVIEHGYREYFARTVANFEAEYEGRPFRIGQDPTTSAIAVPTTTPRVLLDRVKPTLSRTRELGGVVRRLLGVQSRVPEHVDDRGFRHFSAETPQQPQVQDQSLAKPNHHPKGENLRAWLSGLGRALEKDLPSSLRRKSP